jgi:peptidoglycan/LPS O-acetylase OafA/YrhL
VPAANFFRLHLLDDRFPALHGARVVAILSVLQIHVTAQLMLAGAPDSLFFWLSRQVWFGMDLFFFLSGFLIGTMLFHAERAPAGGGRLKRIGRFYARRSFRILPLYDVVLVFLALKPSTVPQARADFVYELFYLGNYRLGDHLQLMLWGWSLCVEEHFYLAVPFVVAALHFVRSSRARLALLLALWASGGALRIATYLARSPAPASWELFPDFYVPTHMRYDILVAGVTLAFAFATWRAEIDRALARPPVRFILGTIAAACAAALLFYRTTLEGGLWDVISWGTITSVMYAALVPLLLAGDGVVKRALSWRGFLPLATLGYGVYLVHVPIGRRLVAPLAMRFMLATGAPAIAAWALALAALFGLSLAVAYALHLAIEKPALSLRDRLTSDPRKTEAVIEQEGREGIEQEDSAKKNQSD